MPVAADVRLGEGVKIFQPDLVNLYGCTVGSETRIGAFVEIQKNAVIGARCKVSSHTFICEGVTVEDEVFIGHGVMFTNDLYPQATNEDGSVQTDSDWADYARDVCETVYHPCGTARIGDVVDTSLAVMGADNLYVVDASVFPSLITVNINAAVMMVAEKAATLIPI